MKLEKMLIILGPLFDITAYVVAMKETPLFVKARTHGPWERYTTNVNYKNVDV